MFDKAKVSNLGLQELARPGYIRSAGLDVRTGLKRSGSNPKPKRAPGQ